jgi:hypothetical protein
MNYLEKGHRFCERAGAVGEEEESLWQGDVMVDT